MLKDARKVKRGFYRAVLESKELGVWGNFGRVPEQDVAFLQGLQDYLMDVVPALSIPHFSLLQSAPAQFWITSATGP